MKKITLYPDNRGMTFFFFIVLIISYWFSIADKSFAQLTPVRIVCFMALIIFNIFYRKISFDTDGLIRIQKKSLFFNLSTSDVFAPDQVSVRLVMIGTVWWIRLNAGLQEYGIANSPFKVFLQKKYKKIAEFLKTNKAQDGVVYEKKLTFWDYLFNNATEDSFAPHFIVAMLSALMVAMFFVQILENKNITPLTVAFGGTRHYYFVAEYRGIWIIIGVLVYVLAGIIPFFLTLAQLCLKINFSIKKKDIPDKYRSLSVFAWKSFGLGVIIGFVSTFIF